MNFLRILILLTCAYPLAAAESIDPLRFEKEVLVPACSDPMQLDIAADGRIIFVERKGAVKMWEPQTRRTVTLGSFPSLTTGDAGALGLALARDFSTSRHVYVFRIPLDPPAVIVISRLTLNGIRLEEEKRLLEIALGKGPVQSHCGGGLAWDREGNLLIGIGDNMPPQDLPAVHPTDASRDARGTAGNSMELRGKILRVTPKPDGSYGIPAGNLFTDASKGRPEIFAMGVRNPFRVACDPLSGWITWGDVGGNVKTSLNLGPEGYDEINITRTPGFFGWPFCSGPNAPWRSFDPKTTQPAGPFYDPQHIINDSPVNTGLKELPPARPAAFWYSSMPSKEWPSAGSGGRSVTGGVFYHRSAGAGENRLPDEWEGALIFGEWMRNWLAVARLNDDGTLASVSFLTHLRFRRPADFKVGPEGALYLAEDGDRWTDNTDSQITRLIYRRGNRPPLAVMDADKLAGRAPLKVAFSARRSSDPDSDGGLRYAWDFGGGKRADGAAVEFTFGEPGVWPVTLTVTDKQGLAAVAVQNVMAGNDAPRVAFTTPLDGGFFEYGKPLEWRLEAMDTEDGSIPPERILVQLERRNRAAGDDETSAHPGLALMRRTTCFACHNATEKSAGPPYATIAAKYAEDSAARDRLSAKIISGGAGAWGEIPMPPHPQHTPAETSQMADWVLSLTQRKVTTLPAGTSGSIDVKEPARQWGRLENSVVCLTASATDKGAGAIPPQRSETSVVLRARRQHAAFYDRGDRATTQDNLDQGGIVARIKAGGWIAFDRVRLSEVSRLKLHCWPQGDVPFIITVHSGTANGPALAETKAASGPGDGKPREIVLAFTHPPQDGPAQAVVIKVDESPGAVLDITRVDFERGE